MESAYLDILKQYWGYDDFRGIQRDIIESIGSGRDTLGLMPTGGGKSITFQVPALAMDGVCIVVTPLIALMKDQVEALRKRNIIATAVHSGMSRDDIVQVLDNCILGHTKFLYVSPERLGTQIFLSKLQFMKISFITIDEAHCISQWGYDFRPSYLHIADIRQQKPDVPVLALTATATPLVVEDIQKQLGFKEQNVLKMSFRRKNLTYVVRRTENKTQEIIHILESVPGTSVVYTRSRLRTKEITEELNEAGITATFYHAGLEHSVKDQRQQMWQRGDYRVMVATNAFGMGIDKADVRTVMHVDCPDSIEAYFQEAGRAGRDGNRAWAVMLVDDKDKAKLNRRVADNFPPKELILDVYEHLAYYFEVAMGFGIGQTHLFDLQKFCYVYKFSMIQVDSALRILQNAGYIEYETNPDTTARMMFIIGRDELYRLKEMSPNEELVITTVMRLYGGMFTDYVYIDESLVAMKSGLERNQVYLTLKGLSKQGIIHFIPQKKMPYITYTRDREETERMLISKEVYELRKLELAKRIECMIAYIQNEDTCRSIQLLDYFGEKGSEECNTCDVCNGKKKNDTSKLDQATDIILNMLSDHRQHHISELNNIVFPESYIEQALNRLVQEEIVLLSNSCIGLL